MHDEKSIFNAARRIETAEARRHYVRRACGDDTALRARVEALLRVEAEDTDFLRWPADGLWPGLPAVEVPGTVIGPYTLRELLDRAAREIEGKFAGQEETEMAIRRTIGRAYMALGEYHEAKKHLDRELVLRLRKHGDRHPDTLGSMTNLGVLELKRGRYPEAEEWYTRVLEARLAEFGPAHPDTPRGKYNLALLHYERGWYGKSAALYEEVLEGFRTTLGGDHTDTRTAAQGLAGAYLHMPERRGTAEQLFRQAADGFRNRFGPDDPRTLTALNGLALLYSETDRPAEAERLFRLVLDTRSAKLEPGHPATLESMQNLATFYLERGRDDEGERLLKQVVDAQRRRLTADHPDTLLSMHNLGVFYRLRRRTAEAEPLLSEVLARVKKAHGLGHVLARSAVNNLTRLYSQQGTPHLAEPLLRESVAFLGTQPESVECATQLGWLALNLLEQEKYTDAEPVAKESLELRTKKASGHWLTFGTMALLGEAIAGQSAARYDEAEPLLRQGYEGMKKQEAAIPGESRGRLVRALRALVRLHDARGNEAEAARYRKELEAETARRK